MIDKLEDLKRLYGEFVSLAETRSDDPAVDNVIEVLKIAIVEITGGGFLTNRTVIRTRSLYNDNTKLLKPKLSELALEIGLNLKNVTFDRVLGAYHDKGRSEYLYNILNEAVQSDPKKAEGRQFQEWRGDLVGLSSLKEVSNRLKQLLAKHGIESLKAFASHMKVMSSGGKRKLPCNATEKTLIQATASHLWKEGECNRSLEGR
jgi:hypothetical protein